jgi:predicted transposase/invertase (TIGR01784 family)
MTKLDYTFKNDVLFKMLFVKHPDLLKRLVAELLGVKFESIGLFEIRNPEMPPETLGDKFCRLDINMTVDDRLINLEIQVRDEGDFPARTLFYWAREYSTSLKSSEKYHELSRVVIISIMDFSLFDCEEYRSEFQALEVTRHEPLTDKMSLRYFELPKLPKVIDANNKLELWLSLFKAETEEELKKIEETEVSVMQEAIGAYRSITASSEFREKERLYAKARHDEAQALYHAKQEERAIWQEMVKDKDAALAEQTAAIADKDAALADKDAEIARLRAQLENR